MAESFIGEIRMFAGNFAPVSWAFCDNNLIPITENQALFSLLENRYGGDGQTTFALPDMRGRIPVHQGTGPGLTPCQLGTRMGVEQITLQQQELATHAHTLQGSNDTAQQTDPRGHVLAQGEQIYSANHNELQPMSSEQVASTGGSQPHYSMMPYICVNFIIALHGIYPQRS